MTRSLRSLTLLGTTMTLVACSEAAPTAPGAVPAAAVAAAGNVVAAAEPAPSGSCTVTPNGSAYDVTVSWYGISPRRIELWQLNAAQPIVQAVYGHSPRKGSATFTVQTSPDYAQVTGSQIGFRVLCLTGA